MVAIALMILLGIVNWKEISGNKTGWDTIVLLAFLVSLAEGLSRTGFIKWFDDSVAGFTHGLSPTLTLYVLVAVFFFAHYFFASTTPHATAMMPVMLAVGMSVPGMNIRALALLLAMTHGIMGVITPYATGPAPVYFGAGYIERRDFWKLGGIFGAIFIASLLALSGTFVLATH